MAVNGQVGKTNRSAPSIQLRTDWEYVRWDFVKAIANNDFTRVVGLIPVAGYLILFNDEIASLASFDDLAGVVEGQTSPFIISGLIKLRMVFFGSLLVLCSFSIYRLFRPNELELSSNDLEFSELVRTRYGVNEIAEMEKQIHSEYWTKRTNAFWLPQGLRRAQKCLVSGYRQDARSSMFSKHGDYIGFLARERWFGMMHTHRVARVSSAMLGVLGYLSLAFPTFDIAQAVMRNLFAG